MSPTHSFETFAAAARERRPRVAVVLGSGMGFVADRVRGVASVAYADVSGLVSSTVPGHRGRLTLGEWGGRTVLLLEGRLHFYEGHPWERVILPVRTAAELGVKVILHTNAAGGIADPLDPGSMMLLSDHVEVNRPFWWREPGPGGLGPARGSPYSPRLAGCVDLAARRVGIELHRGVYAALTGPCYETPAEIRALKHWGVDAVGMSTAREVVVGAGLGLECAAVSLITNRAAGLSPTPLSHAEVLETAMRQAGRLAALLEEFVVVEEKG